MSLILTPISMHFAFLQVSVGPALNHSQERSIVVLDRHSASGLIQGSVGLDEDLAWLLVIEDHLADLGAPEVQANGAHLGVKVGTSFHIRS